MAIALKVSRKRFDVRLRPRAALNDDPHEEVAGLDIVELLGVEDVEPAVEQGGRDFRDDPGPVDARKVRMWRALDKTLLR